MDSVQENVCLLEANYLVVGREENRSLVSHKVEIMEPRRDHLCCKHDLVVKHELRLFNLRLFSVHIEPLKVQPSESLHSHGHPVVETGDTENLFLLHNGLRYITDLAAGSNKH